MVAAFDPLLPGDVTLTSSEGTLDDGSPFVTFDTELGTDQTLAVGATSAVIPLAFSNPNRHRIECDVRFLTDGANEAPRFVTAPETTVVFDSPYVYSAATTDADGDKVTYELVSAPAGMVADADSGELTWAPALSDLGTHTVPASGQ